MTPCPVPPSRRPLRSPRRRRRVGLVLGAGGTLGAAWMVGALGAVQERIGRPLQDLDVIVGTSAGSPCPGCGSAHPG
jgi:predicted acylesterase/phospholipase RssA